MSKRLLVKGGAAVLIALAAATGPAMAGDMPERTTEPALTEPGPPNYPRYDPQFEVPSVTAQDSGIDASSAALGALAGIALAGAGLGTAYLVVRHRDHHTAPQSA